MTQNTEVAPPPRPLAPEWDNIVPPDQGARRGWVFMACKAGSASQRDRIKINLTIEHITSGVGFEVGGIDGR